MIEPITFHDGRVQLYAGDCLDVLDTLEPNSIDSVVTDPPYALTSIVKRFGREGSAPAQFGKDGAYQRASKGFMNKNWDNGKVAFDPEVWIKVLRVLKPGGFIVAFGGTRTFHRLVCAIEGAGFEIRDTISWNYGQGFPKSHNVSRKLKDRSCRCEALSECDVRPMQHADVSKAVATNQEHREILLDGLSKCDTQSTVLRPQSEERAQGGSQPGVEERGHTPQEARQLRLGAICEMSAGPNFDGENGWVCDGASPSNGSTSEAATTSGRVRPPSRSQTAKQRPVEPGAMAGQPEPQVGGTWPHCERCGKPIIPDGLGTALKPAMELICVARKPLIGTVAENVLTHGTGALNIDGCRVPTPNGRPSRGNHTDRPSNNTASSYDLGSRFVLPDTTLGRWPANLCHDGSPEVLAAFPETTSGKPGDSIRNSRGFSGIGDSGLDKAIPLTGFGDSGSAARFYYSAKADSDDRLGSRHPTVKPLDLISWLIRLVTPPGGTVLDCFAGTGTTGHAALIEGMRAILIEREAEYIDDITRRMGLVYSGRDERARKLAKVETEHGLPLFGGARP